MPISEVFISSTVNDLAAYRHGVKEALEATEEVACFLSEDGWAGGYDDTVEQCRKRVQRAGGFFLLLGYYYGSTPPGSQKSITHLEFEWAFKKWRKLQQRPMSVLKPERDSEADIELYRAAEQYLPADPDDRKRHDELRDGFHREITNAWQTVKFFRDKPHLREWALVSWHKWSGQSPVEAARKPALTGGGSQVSGAPTDAQLGLLGRDPQLKTLRRVRTALVAASNVPAVALLVSGDEDAGQEVFLEGIKADMFREFRPGTSGRLPAEQYDIEVLTQWIGASLGMPERGESRTPEQLAEEVAAELKSQGLYFILNQVNRLAGGLEQFQRAFWTPFYKRLVELRGQLQFRNRIFAILVDYTGNKGSADTVSGPDFGAAPPEYGKLIALPSLDPFTPEDVLDWFDTIRAPDDGSGRLAQIARTVLQKPGGEHDPLPSRVLARLRRESIFPPEEETDP